MGSNRRDVCLSGITMVVADSTTFVHPPWWHLGTVLVVEVVLVVLLRLVLDRPWHEMVIALLTGVGVAARMWWGASRPVPPGSEPTE